MFISLMEKPGLVNLDFADIVAILRDADNMEGEKGDAMMGTGRANGEDRAMRAAEAAISCFLLETEHIRRAKAAMVQVSGREDMTLTEIDAAVHFIRSQIEDEASDRPQASNIIFGATFDHAIPEGEIQISVVATGIRRDGEGGRAAEKEEKAPTIDVVQQAEQELAKAQVESSPNRVDFFEAQASMDDLFEQKLADMSVLGRRHGDFGLEPDRFSAFSSLREDAAEEGYNSSQESSYKEQAPEKRVSRFKKFFSRRTEDNIPYVKENFEEQDQESEDLSIPAFLRKAGKAKKTDKY